MHKSSKRLQDIVIRISDIVLATLALICLSPFFAIVGILIKLDSFGEVFFKQERVGMNGTIFKMYKFRSMYHNADKMAHQYRSSGNGVIEPVIKTKNDMRVTRIGEYLRRFSIDELPQLINVIKGDMSLVGPRPPVLMEVELYSDYHKQRLEGKPGLTGLAQITERSELPFDKIVELDIYYLQHKSIKLYYKLIFQTIPFLLSAKGAY